MMAGVAAGGAPALPSLSPKGWGGAGAGERTHNALLVDDAQTMIAPLTPTLSPQGRGGEPSSIASEQKNEAPLITSPLRGEVDAQRRVRGSVSRARLLRSRPTDAEQKLWSILRARQLGGFKFVRQFQIGPNFADFACREAALIIEADGRQHAENLHDEQRTAYLNAQGYSVLRFWNDDILTNLHGVADTILAALTSHPSPDLRFAPATLAPERRGEKGAIAASTQRSYRRTAELPRLVKE